MKLVDFDAQFYKEWTNRSSWTIDQMLLTNLIPVFVASKLEVYKMAKVFTKTTNHLNFG